jgi:outer membrane protein TolC
VSAGRLWLAAAALALSACAPLALEQDERELGAYTQAHLGARAKPLLTEADRRGARDEAARLLAAPLGADDAVRLALVNSASLQAMLAQSARESADATQSARPPNPVFTFERLVRDGEHGVEKEVTRMLSFPVLELLALPARMDAAAARQKGLRLATARDALQAATQARQAWVRAVAARQSLAYHEQVRDAADAAAELARRMQAVGNWSRLQRAREHAFYADAQAQLARARHEAVASREALVRALGLDAQQAASLQLPERLPDLPASPDDEAALARFALDERLDMRIARAELEALARLEGLTRVTSYVDGLHVAAVNQSETGEPKRKGYEIELPLPIFDFGDARRASARAAYLAALNRVAATGLEAASQVREGYSAYRTAYDLARHYRDEIVPLRRTIADEMLLKYNGMLIGVFELLADSRAQAGSVIQSIEAQRDFWLADAGLRSTLLGLPSQAPAMAARAAATSGADERH